jgi:hypothetical protein
MFINAKDNLTTSSNWSHAQTLFGITTYYRRELDHSLSIKIEGELHGLPLFEQMVVLRECDLYHLWAPFCTKSRKLAQLDKLDVVAWYMVGVSLVGLSRDACYRAVGCDCMNEDGSVLLVAVGLNDSEEYGVKDELRVGNQDGKLVDGDDGDLNVELDDVGEHLSYVGDGNEQHQQHEKQKLYREERTASSKLSDSTLVDTTASSFLTRDAILETIEIPPIPQGMGRGRMTIRNFAAGIDVLGPSSARTKLVVNVDPNLHFIPQSLIDFCMKRMCGVLLSRLQATARKVVKDPIKNPHARRMREDVSFYRDWLLPKFRVYCDESGWSMPPVKAFDVSEEDLKAEGIFEGWRADCNTASSNLTATPIKRYRGDDNTSLDSSHSLSPTASSTSSKSSRLGKVRQYIHDHEHRASQKRLEKIASARQRAAKRLEPEPFSQSKVSRLKELKDAKMRAEERVRSKSAGSGESLSSFGKAHTTYDFEDDVDVKRYVVIFTTSLGLIAMMLPLQPHALSNVSVSAVSELMDLFTRDAITLSIITAQATALWALLNAVLIFAFDSIDFGQKQLAKNLEYGKKLYVNAVRRYTFVVSVCVATLSLGFGLLAAAFQASLNKLCSLVGGGLMTILSSGWTSILEAVPSEYSGAFDVVVGWTSYVAHRLPIATVYRHARMMLSWFTTKLSSISPVLLTKIVSTITTLATQNLSSLLSSQLRMCETQSATSSIASWRLHAYEISTSVTSKLGVFIVALLLMGRIILPKPEKKLRKKTSATAQKDLLLRKMDSDISDISSLNSTRFSPSGHHGKVSSMDVISENDEETHH